MLIKIKQKKKELILSTLHTKNHPHKKDTSLQRFSSLPFSIEKSSKESNSLTAAGATLWAVARMAIGNNSRHSLSV